MDDAIPDSVTLALAFRATPLLAIARPLRPHARAPPPPLWCCLYAIASDPDATASTLQVSSLPSLPLLKSVRS
jgi:hypothetical protein